MRRLAISVGKDVKVALSRRIELKRLVICTVCSQHDLI
jgi:hypothetical protein